MDELREELYQCISSMGVKDLKTVQVSQKLDEYIVQEMLKTTPVMESRGWKYQQVEMNIGLMIGKERTKRNMTQNELAKKVGCTTRALQYWECGKRNITLEYLDKVLKALNLTMKIGCESGLG